jgi:hypothetical protein
LDGFHFFGLSLAVPGFSDDGLWSFFKDGWMVVFKESWMEWFYRVRIKIRALVWIQVFSDDWMDWFSRMVDVDTGFGHLVLRIRTSLIADTKM